MAKKSRKKNSDPSTAITDYRFSDKKRKYITPAGLAAQGVVEEAPKMQFTYDPHLPPQLRFDETGETDKLPELLEKATRTSLTKEEAELLAEALRKQEPWLEWTGKREKKYFEVDPVALHIHERVSTQAILKVAKREHIQRDLFADPDFEYREAVKFYKHDMDWANRLILGDSLQVMASLAYRENLAGQVQLIYIDPPYGIKFSSNFQSEVGKREVKDSDNDLTREPEMIKAYRDTWTLGIHSYLSYLRDRLILARTLLKDSGSIFVQIGEENVHHLKELLEAVFGAKNYVSTIVVTKTTTPRLLIDNNNYFLLWFAKDIDSIRYNQLYLDKPCDEWARETKGGSWGATINYVDRQLTPEEKENTNILQAGSEVYQLSGLTSSGAASENLPFNYRGADFFAGSNNHWKTGIPGLGRLNSAERIESRDKKPWFKKYHKDFPATRLTNLWTDTSGKTNERIYVVQTQDKVIERCVLMTSQPGDLILDPTCGSGTTAYCSEQWGRRWITIDSSRVAIALARQRLLTSKFEHFKLIDENRPLNESNPFVYEVTSRITLKNIAQNVALDPIFNKYQPLLNDKIKVLNGTLIKVSNDLRLKLLSKLEMKKERDGKKSITEADERRWKLPKKEIQHWEVPFDTDEDYPATFKNAIEEYRKTWRAKMDEVNACIQANAEPVELVDKPEKESSVVRVSGPFTVEGVMPAEFNSTPDSPIEEMKDELEAFDQATNAVSYLDNMHNLLRKEGVNFLGNKQMKFQRLDDYQIGGNLLHFEGEWINGDNKSRKVGVSVGPQHGPVTAWQVENVIRIAYKHGFDDIVFAGFSFTAEAQSSIQEDVNSNVRTHLAMIRPDVQMTDLLKSTGTGQVFTVFGSPRTKLSQLKDGQFQVEMEGVDIYDPVLNVLVPTHADKVAAWFLDSDYDGRTFCITQAFFPDRDAWKKLEKALHGVIDPEKFEAFSGTVSLSFPEGEQKRIAVKVIDPRGNEVMKVHSLDKSY